MRQDGISITWSIEDALKIRPDLTDEQAIDVLQVVYDNHDVEVGVSWDTLEFWADAMFPRSADRRIFTVEISEALQLRIDVEADSPAEALAKVERAYKSGEYVLGAEHFTGVDISVIDDAAQGELDDSGGAALG